MANSALITQQVSLTTGVTGTLPVANGGTGVTASTGSGSTVLGTTPTLNQANLVGTTTNNNAAAGSVGEYIEAALASGSAISLTTSTAANVTSISLTAGDWDVCGSVNLTLGATSSIQFITVGTNSTSATMPTAPDASRNGQFTAATIPTTITTSHAVGTKRYSLSATTTIYLIALCTFISTAPAAYGIIRARRVR